jgi:hypothetical protein
MTSTLTDPKVQNISTIVTLTNAEKFEKYSNDVMTDLSAILPVSLPGLALNQTLPPTPPLPSIADTGGISSDDDSDDE